MNRLGVVVDDAHVAPGGELRERDPADPQILVWVALLLAASTLTFRFIEQPFLRWKVRS